MSETSGHACFDLVNKSLEGTGYEIDVRLTICMDSDEMGEKLPIPVRRSSTGAPSGKAMIFCVFCPVCGVRIRDKRTETPPPVAPEVPKAEQEAMPL